jgi:uncharacterized protein YggE
MIYTVIMIEGVIMEDCRRESEPPLPLIAPRTSLAKTAPVPIEPGEDTLRIRVTVGFDIGR